MNKLFLLLCSVTLLYSCKDEHPIQTPEEAAFDNYAKVMRIVSVSRDEIVLKNNTGALDTISVFYSFRTSDSTDLELIHKPASVTDYITIGHQQFYTYQTPYPVDFMTDTVFLYVQKPHMPEPVIADMFLPPGKQVGF